MLHLPNNGYKVYMVELFNQQVRSLVTKRRRHSFFNDHWAEVQVRDVVARSETEARALIAERFPPEDGFVVQAIVPERF